MAKMKLLYSPSSPYVRKALVRSTSFLGGVRRYMLQIDELRLIVDHPTTEFEARETDVWVGVDPRAGFHVLPRGRE